MSRFALIGKQCAVTPRNSRGGLIPNWLLAMGGKSRVNSSGVIESAPLDHPGRQSLQEALVPRVGKMPVQVVELILRGARQTLSDLPSVVEAAVGIHAFEHPGHVAAGACFTRTAQ